MPVVTLELDDAVIAGAKQVTGLDSAEAAVEEWLRRIVRAEEQRRALDDIRGLGWEGDLDELRAPRF